MLGHTSMTVCLWRHVRSRETSFSVKGNAVGRSIYNVLAWTSLLQGHFYVRSAPPVRAGSIIHISTILKSLDVIVQFYCSLTAGFVNVLLGTHSCFSCKNLGEDVRRCMLPGCGKFYHGECAASHGPTVPLNRAFRCPLHACLSCFITNPTNPSVSKGLLCLE